MGTFTRREWHGHGDHCGIDKGYDCDCGYVEIEFSRARIAELEAALRDCLPLAHGYYGEFPTADHGAVLDCAEALLQKPDGK